MYSYNFRITIKQTYELLFITFSRILTRPKIFIDIYKKKTKQTYISNAYKYL